VLIVYCNLWFRIHLLSGHLSKTYDNRYCLTGSMAVSQTFDQSLQSSL